MNAEGGFDHGRLELSEPVRLEYDHLSSSDFTRGEM